LKHGFDIRLKNAMKAKCSVHGAIANPKSPALRDEIRNRRNAPTFAWRIRRGGGIRVRRDAAGIDHGTITPVGFSNQKEL